MLNYSASNILCGIIYRHPNSNLENFFEYINSLTGKIDHGSKHCVILGDFNIDLLKIESHQQTDEFLDSMSTHLFQPHILQPTRITYHSATLIDNLFFNSLEHFTISGNIVFDISDHLPNFLIFDKFFTLSDNIKLYKRDFSKFNQQDLRNEFQLLDWQTEFLHHCDSSTMFGIFYVKISSIVDKHCPIKKLSREERKLLSKPWITSALRKSI